jgi:hypothetical protein
MANAQAMIRRAYKLIGVLDPRQTMSSEMAQDGLDVLNAMLSTLGASRLNVYSIERTEFALTVGQQDYELGTGGDFNIPKPAKIHAVSVIPGSSPTLEIPIESINDDDWQNISIKSQTGQWPTVWLESSESPLNILTFWPIPNTACKAVFYYWKRLQSFTLTDNLAMPDGYEEYITYSLAVRLAPYYQVAVRPDVVAVLRQAETIVKSNNYVQGYLGADPAWLSGGSDTLATRTNGYLID